MITVTIPATESYDATINEFVYTKEVTLRLEHSLVAISKWESKWLKPFLGKEEKTSEEIYDYINCMIINYEDVESHLVKSLTQEQINSITEYIKSPSTATSIKQTGKPSREVITSELLYYSMITHNIPFECQYWHINKLSTLIQICDIKSQPAKKMSKNDVMTRNKALNDARRKAMGSSG